MATMEGARGTKTRIKVGQVEADVILHGTVADAPKLSEYATAGPHGRPLRYVDRAAVAPVEETPVEAPVPVHSGSPLADEDRDARARLAAADELVVTEGSTGFGSQPGVMRQVLIEAPGEGQSDDDMPELTREDIRRGMRLDGGKFVDLTDQLAGIDARTKLDRMEVVHTLAYSEVPRSRVQGSYYLSADDESAPHVLRVLFESMRRVRRVAVVKWTARTKQSLGVVVADGNTGALVVLKLAWAEDVRDPGEKQLAHQQATAYEIEIDSMGELLLAIGESRRRGLDVIRDDARELREELEAAVKAGDVSAFEVPVDVAVPEEPTALADLLAASVEAVRAA